MTFALLALAVTVAFAVETIAGFGATVISVSLAAHLFPVHELLPVLVPLNVLLSTYLVARYRAHVDRKLLATRILPLAGLGMPLGMYAFNNFPGDILKPILGVFVTVVSSIELWRLVRTGDVRPRPLTLPKEAAILVTGGVIHGALSTGGPLIVYWASRVIDDKQRFRATLSVLWLLSGLILLANYAAHGLITGAGLLRTAALTASVLLGIGIGEIVHARVSEARFRLLAYALLLFTGVSLIISSL